MTRPGKSTPPLARLFAADPQEAMLSVLREAEAPLKPVEVKRRLQAVGVPVDATERAWSEVQKRIRSHDHVVVEKGRYRWAPKGRAVTPLEALALLGTGRPPAGRKAALIAIVREALSQSSSSRGAGSVPARGQSEDPEQRARERQAQVDAVRVLAELAMEVEELTANEASATTMVHRVRARVQRSGLEPIERAGEETTFDRKRHKPIGSSIPDGAPVVVVRPGYVWRGPTEDVQIAKAVVEE